MVRAASAPPKRRMGRELEGVGPKPDREIVIDTPAIDRDEVEIAVLRQHPGHPGGLR